MCLEEAMPRISVNIKNGDNYDSFVTISDLNVAGHPKVWTDKRLNGGDTEPVDLEADGSGLAKVKWTANRADNSSETNTENAESYANGTIFVSTV
jgi:hypothetical protein